MDFLELKISGLKESNFFFVFLIVVHKTIGA